MVKDLSVVLVGAGPIGSAAAAELFDRESILLIRERGATAGTVAGEWDHVKALSRRAELIAPAMPS
ncbi:hypothetical protein [Nocardia niwae]|uniref:hypothetical protein n=1 Tax=Nocardia niwae TaxID=626084 RepID=UPI0007A5141F|nr:hypothetical protein [Nocardia niwae]